MVSPTCLLMKLMICFGLLGIFIRISHTQPLFDENDDDNDQIQAYQTPYLNNYLVGSGRYIRTNPYRLNIPENLYDYHQQNIEYNPENIPLAKRIIMLPRVGRRSVRST